MNRRMNRCINRRINRRQALRSAALLAAGAGLSAFRWPFTPDPPHESLLVAGSTTCLELTKILANAYVSRRPGLDISVDGGGSAAGYAALTRGALDAATMSRDLTADEDSSWVRNFLFARDGEAIVANKANPLDDLRPADIKGLFVGRITNWKEVGGRDAPVRVISAPADTPRYQNLLDMVIDGDDVVRGARLAVTPADTVEAVAADPNAIGFLRLKDIDPKIKLMKVGGVEMTKATILSGRYLYSRQFYLVLYGDKNPLAQDFVDYTRSAAGQKIIEEQFYIPVR